ncbi:MAG: ATP-binding protein, partial [Bacteroidota bacterium]
YNAARATPRYKESKGQLKLKVEAAEKALVVRIEDDGIGRARSKALKTKNQRNYKSTGLDNVNRRLALINELYETNYNINIQDLDPQAEDSGTVVTITIPIKKA